MYHLRRSPFLRTFNTSPDETTFYRLILNRECTSNCIIMIQPTLYCYSFNAPPHAVLLDAQNVQPNVILLLDTFFHVLIHHGEVKKSFLKLTKKIRALQNGVMQDIISKKSTNISKHSWSFLKKMQRNLWKTDILIQDMWNVTKTAVKHVFYQPRLILL